MKRILMVLGLMMGLLGFGSPAFAQDDSQPPDLSAACPSVGVHIDVDEPLQQGSFTNCTDPYESASGIRVDTIIQGVGVYCGGSYFEVTSIQRGGSFDGKIFLELDVACDEVRTATYINRECPGRTEGMVTISYPAAYEVRYRCNDDQSGPDWTANAVLDEQNNSGITGTAIVKDYANGSTISIEVSDTSTRYTAWLYSGTCDHFDRMVDQVGGLGVINGVTPLKDSEFMFSSRDVRGDENFLGMIVVIFNEDSEVVACGPFH